MTNETILSRPEICKRFNINKSQWYRRHDDVLEHLQDFMNIEEVKNGQTYLYKIIGEIPEYIPPLPRKSTKPQKQARYTGFVGERLTNEPKPESKMHMAREAIKEFGEEEYGHKSPISVARVYTGPAMEEIGERVGCSIWVEYHTYEPLSDEEVTFLRKCFKEVGLTQQHMVESYTKLKMGDDSASQEDDSLFMQVRRMFQQKYEKTPVIVSKWKLKQKQEEYLNFGK